MRHLNLFILAALCAGAVGLVSQVTANPITRGTFTFDSDDSATSGTVATTGSTGTSTFGAGLVPEDPSNNTVGQLLGGPGDSIDIASGGSFAGGRTTIELFWDPGEGVQNLTGDDLFVLENGGVGRPEAFALAVREFGSSTFTQHRFEFADEFDASNQQYITAYDLTDFGIADNAFVDAVQIISLHNATATTPPNLEDRVDLSSHEGVVSQDVGSGTGFEIWGGPLATDGTFIPDPGGAFPDGAMDADITYVAGSNSGPASVPLFSYCDDFNTDTSGNYTIILDDEFTPFPASPVDAVITFAYDYSTFTGTDPAATTIPVAPKTTDASTLGLYIQVNNNDDTAGDEGVGVNLYPNDGGSPLSLGPGMDYVMTFDAFLMYNGPAEGGGGSTETLLAGVNHSGTLPAWRFTTAADSDGFHVNATGEHGAANDYSMWVGGGTGAGFTLFDELQTDIVYALGDDNAATTTGAPYDVYFPSPPYETVGAPGKLWAEVELLYQNDALFYSINGNLISTFTNNTSFTSGAPMIGYGDFFNSVAATTADNFIVIDNLCIQELAPTTAVDDFSLYR